MRRVGILGGGLQGCCIALELASRGFSVTLVDENDALLTRTAVANEGKIHLGYMYAADPSLRTARTMMSGALAFQPFLRRHLGSDLALDTSSPAAYVVHRDSQHGIEEVEQYLTAVHDLVIEAAAKPGAAYLTGDVSAPVRRWSDAEVKEHFDPSIALAVFGSPEVAIDPLMLAELVRARIAADPRIEVRTGRVVESVRRQSDGGFAVTGRHTRQAGSPEDAWSIPFDQVVNAMWGGRIAADETMGHRPDRPWIHRLKYGVSVPWPESLMAPHSATIISGPFGEVVSYPDRTTYLTWYPACVVGFSSAVSPPAAWQTYPADPLRSEVISGTVAGLAELIPSLGSLPDGTSPRPWSRAA